MPSSDQIAVPPRPSPDTDGHLQSAETVEVVSVLEEQLTVSKKVVESGGGLRLSKKVYREEVSVAEPLALERLSVQRVPINRVVDVRPPVRYEGDITVFSILEERLVTRKELVLLEELHVSKVSHVDQTAQKVVLRREEIVVERQDPSTGEWTLERTAP